MIKEIARRRSVRSYKADLPSDEDILEVIKAGQFAPTGKNTKAWEFIVIKDLKTKEEIFNIVGQEYVKEAPVLIIPVMNSEASITPVQDLSLSSGYIFLQAESLGLGTVWKNVGEEKREEVKKLLAIPQNFLVINIIPLGYPKEEPSAHREEDFDRNKIHFEKW